MKNFFKKLSFVLAAAMVVTSLHVPAEAKAASKDYVFVKGSKKAITAKSLFVGGNTVNFDYVVGKMTNKGANGKWSVADETIATVDKAGVVTAVGVGETTLTFTAKKSKAVKKAVKKTVKLTTYARAEEVSVSPAALEVVVGKTVEADVTLKVSEALEKAGVKSSYKTYAVIDNASTAAVKVENGKLVVEAKEVTTASPAVITVFAAQKDTAEAAMENKYKKEVKVDLTVKADFSAKQAGANKIKVMGTNLATDPALYVLKNDKGTVYNLVKGEVKLNEEKTEATLVADMPQILEGKYVVTFNKTDAMLDVVKAKPAKIVFDNQDKKAIGQIVKTNTSSPDVLAMAQATITYKVFDQFDDDITNTSLTDLNVSTNYKILSTDASDAKKGKIVVVNKAGSGTDGDVTDLPAFNMFTDRIVVSITDVKTGANVNDVFTVGEESRVKEIVFEGLADKDLKKVESISEDYKSEDFSGDNSQTKPLYALFSIKDQYGNAVSVDTAKDQLTVYAAGVPGITVRAYTANPKDNVRELKVGDKKYIAVELDTSKNARVGEVIVNAIGNRTGTKAEGKFNVTPARKVASISISAPNKGVYYGEDNYLDFTAEDQDGKPVKEYSLLKDVKFNLGATVLNFVPQLDGTAKLRFNKSGDVNNDSLTTSVPEVIVATVANYKTSTFTINVNMKRRPQAFLGLVKDFKTGVTDGKSAVDTYGENVANTIEILPKHLRFEDQYGNELTGEEVIKTLGLNTYYLKFSTGEDLAGFTATKLATDEALGLTKAAAQVLKLDDTFKVVLTPKALTDKSLKDVLNLQLMKAVADTEANYLGGSVNVSFVAARLADLSSFGVDTIDVQPASDLYTSTDTTDPAWKKNLTYKLRPSVYGMYEGIKIKLHNDEYSIYNGVARPTNSDAAIAKKLDAVTTRNIVPTDADTPAEFYVRVPNMKAIAEGKDTDTAEFEVLIKNRPDKNFKVKYEYSKKAAKVSKVESKIADVAGMAFKIGTDTVKWDNTTHDLRLPSSALDVQKKAEDPTVDYASSGDPLTEFVKVYDQYGKNIYEKDKDSNLVHPRSDLNPYVTFKVSAEDAKLVEITNNGFQTAEIKFTTAVGVNLPANTVVLVDATLVFADGGYKQTVQFKIVK